MFPFVLTSYRLTEHHTAGGMSRTVPYLSELQPELFCEVSPELAAERGLEHGDWATIVTARSRGRGARDGHRPVRPLQVQGPHDPPGRAALPLGRSAGSSPATRANDLFSLALDPNVHIQECKAATCDIRPGRRPRGKALLALVEDYRRAGRGDGTRP